ncbi:MAG: RCC1-like domain-containing protein [Armatimonadota bacterium]
MDLRSQCTAVAAKVLVWFGCITMALTLVTTTQAAVEPGIVRIWGLCSTPSALPAGVKDISAEDNHTMILHDDGSITAWGITDMGIGQVPEPNAGYKAIATTFLHALPSGRMAVL